MQGHEPFSGLDTFADEVLIQTRFALHQFSVFDHLLVGRVVHRCWTGAYADADEIVRDLEALST